MAEISETAQTVLDLIRNRRTLPFSMMKTDPIPDDQLNLLFESANWAPTHKYTEPWRFVLYTGEGRKRIAAVLGAVYRETIGDKFIEKSSSKPRRVR